MFCKTRDINQDPCKPQIELLSSYLHDDDNPIKRVYIPMMGGRGTVLTELEYESMAEWQRAWDAWRSPDKVAELRRENELASGGIGYFHLSFSVKWGDIHRIAAFFSQRHSALM